MEGIKHLIQCHCVLPQYRKRKEPVFHKFVAFSVIDDENEVVSKLVACNNCAAVHRVTEISKSEIVPSKENSRAVVTQAELALSLPKDLAELFKTYNADLATWEEAVFIIDYKKWGTVVTMSREDDDNVVRGKTLEFLGPERFRVSAFSRDAVL